MKRSRGNNQQPRDAGGRFESKTQASRARSGQGASPQGKEAARSRSGGPCRDDMGRFESCE